MTTLMNNLPVYISSIPITEEDPQICIHSRRVEMVEGEGQTVWVHDYGSCRQ